jgi:hypothetical protein
MRKEDWKVISARKEIGMSSAVYKFKDTSLRLKVYEGFMRPKSATWHHGIGADKKYITISDFMERSDVQEKDKIALSYYINIKYDGHVWRQEFTNEFITIMHGGINKWKEFVIDNADL